MTYRIRLTADVPPWIPLSEHLNGLLVAFKPVQAGSGWLADRRDFGIYGVARNIRDVVLPASVEFSLELMVWTNDNLDDPDALLDRFHERWAGALERLPLPMSADRQAQRIWRGSQEDGEALFLHSSGLTSRFSVYSAITPDMWSQFSNLALGEWTPVCTPSPGSDRWMLSIPREGGADEMTEVRALAGADLPDAIGRLWQLEAAWAEHKRVARTHTTKRGAKLADARREGLRRTWDRALAEPSSLRRPKARTKRPTADDLWRFQGDVWTGRVRNGASEAEHEWERFWLRRSGLEPRPESLRRRRTPQEVADRGASSDER